MLDFLLGGYCLLRVDFVMFCMVLLFVNILVVILIGCGAIY